MIGLGLVHVLAGAMFLGFAVLTLVTRRDARRSGTALFWALLATTFLLGDRIGDLANGVLAIATVLLAASGRIGPAPNETDDVAARDREATRHGDRLFLPALLIPFVALVGTIFFKAVPGIVQPANATLVSLAMGAVLAAGICLVWLRSGPLAPFGEGVRLMNGLGWMAVMPQMLASLGVIYAASGMGTVMGDLLGYVPTGGSLLAQVAIYCAGMAVMTILIGNALAAFPVMFAAMGMPLLVTVQHGDAAAVAAIGMLAGFCGTLMTPMAANFNLVPAALLKLRDDNGVIRAQMPTAVMMLAANILLLYFLGFPK